MSDGAGPGLLYAWWLGSLLADIVLVGLGADPAAAQQIVTRSAWPDLSADSADVVASDAYLAGRLHRFLLGQRYRRVWAEPIRVPVLNLRRFAGGLTPLERGGGYQTQSLRLQAANGQEFSFRSLDKNPVQGLPAHLRTSAVIWLVRDQTSAMHPGGALAAAAFAQATGIPHAAPELVLMPDDPALGEFRSSFGGMLGTIEVRPEGGKDGTAGFAGFTDVVTTEEVVRRLNAGTEDRLNAPMFLKARLLDMFLNDWDRHAGNWRWGTHGHAPPQEWLPIPNDRDRVFSGHDGVLIGIARLGFPRLIPFTGDYHLRGLSSNSRALDARALASLDARVWDSVAASLQAQLSDSVIAAALLRMPEPYHAMTGDGIAAKLRSRRDKLRHVAAAYYAQLAHVVDVHASDDSELLHVRRGTGGSVEVTLEQRRSHPSAPHFRRTFVPEETREVRVYLHGGDDTVAVSGEGSARVLVRVIAGKGRDTFPPAGQAHGVRSYEVPGDSAWYPPDSLVEPALDRRPWFAGPHGAREPPPTDRGGRVVPSVSAGYVSELGLVLQGKMALVRYGFRTEPHATRLSLAISHATALGASRVDLAGDFARESSPIFVGVSASASGLERPWFFGLGNTSGRGAPPDAYRTSHRQYHAGVEIGRRERSWLVAAGPFVSYARTDPPALAVPAFGRGTGDYGYAGLGVRMELDRRDATAHPRRGVRLAAGATLVPGMWDAPGTFGTLRAAAATYLAPPLPLSPVLALRAGASRAWGPYPWFESPSVGGESSLRGYDVGRFAGDAAAYGGAELRARVFGFSLGVPGDLGILAATDVGRVWLDGENSSRWHSSWGGGVWVSLIDPNAILSATIADGDRTMLYVRGGFAF